MMTHPVATAEQHKQELAALKLIEHPTVKAAYEQVYHHWLEILPPSDVMRACFDEAFKEVMFSAAIWSSNQDPLRPKVSVITRLAHTVNGQAIPGSRWGIDNPDSIYRVIPISGDEKYLIHGRVGKNRMTENYFTLWDDKMGTVDVLDGNDLVCADDGSFTITVDSEPAGDRVNHVQSSPTAHEFYIRDVMLNWDKDDPNELTIERLGDEPSTPPMTDDEQAELTAKMMMHFATFTTMLSKGSFRRPANDFSLAVSGDNTGMLRNQVYVGGHFKLADDEAFVIDINDGGAAYFTVPIANIWGTTLDILNRTSTLNKAQSVANTDGTYTYVLCEKDPGVHNWLDTCGFPEGMLTLRMAEFPGKKPSLDLSAQGRVVKFNELAKHLPEGTIYLDADGRAQQRAARARAYSRRLPEIN
ncbi:MAG: hypothetical protein VX231_00145 [Pseudomonadota bacterium]|nr:hypothetical protein [Pseudomonadota bacterium]